MKHFYQQIPGFFTFEEFYRWLAREFPGGHGVRVPDVPLQERRIPRLATGHRERTHHVVDSRRSQVHQTDKYGGKETDMGKNEPTLAPVTVTISGPHDSGRTTFAHLVKEFLKENEYRFVNLEDVEPLPAEEKDRFSARFARNRYLRAVNIRVVLEDKEV